MKTMFENMISLIITMIFVFVFTAIISIEVQVINARNIHSRVVEVYQDSYHTLSASYFNDLLSNGYVELNTVNDSEFEVIYVYDVKIPFLNIVDEQRIVGYAR